MEEPVHAGEQVGRVAEGGRHDGQGREKRSAVVLGVQTVVEDDDDPPVGRTPDQPPEALPQPYDSNWKGGFFCVCHGSRVDLAGRVYKGVPAPLNLEIPPHKYISETLILIGDGRGAA